MSEEADYHVYKIAVLGWRRSGKTTLINRFINQNSNQYYPPTTNDFQLYTKLDCVSKDLMNPKPYFLLIQDTVGLNNPILHSNKELQKHLMKITENQETIALVDPFQFPWDQDERQFYAYIFVVSRAEIEGFEDVVRTFIDRITQIERDRKRNHFITKKIIVGTFGDTRDAGYKKNKEQWELIKKEFEDTNIRVFEVSCFDKLDAVDEIFTSIVKDLHINPTIQKFENQIFAGRKKAVKKSPDRTKASKSHKDIARTSLVPKFISGEFSQDSSDDDDLQEAKFRIDPKDVDSLQELPDEHEESKKCILL